jgi:hypothetical protein
VPSRERRSHHRTVTTNELKPLQLTLSSSSSAGIAYRGFRVLHRRPPITRKNFSWSRGVRSTSSGGTHSTHINASEEEDIGMSERKGPVNTSRPGGLIYFRPCVIEINRTHHFKCRNFDSTSPATPPTMDLRHRKNRAWKTLIEFTNTAHKIGLISCTKTVLVASPCHPLFPLALTRNLAPGSTTSRNQTRPKSQLLRLNSHI